MSVLNSMLEDLPQPVVPTRGSQIFHITPEGQEEIAEYTADSAQH